MTMERYWETTALDAMSEEQWEGLCDGCGRCCLQKLQDVDTSEVFFTRISCRQLDLQNCRCKDYEKRAAIVPDCTQVKPLTEEKRHWLPKSCAYRRLSEGRGLASWHPLISGDKQSVHRAGISVQQLAISEEEVPLEHYEQYLIEIDGVEGFGD